MAVLASRLQAVDESHIGYLGTDPDSIATDIAGVDRWIERTAVAEEDGRMLGWLLGEKDDEMGRVWWWGPFCLDSRSDVADDLYRLAGEAVAASEEELAPDERNRWVAECAGRWGFRSETASAVLRYTGPLFGEDPAVVPVGPSHAAEVAALHDRLFPGTHTPGSQLLESDHLRLVRVVDGVVVGYVAAEVQSDRSGYIDYLGVDLEFRGQGIGRALVKTAADRIRELGADSINLTVRETNGAARSLYASLGFVEERVIRPYRKGFTLETGVT